MHYDLYIPWIPVVKYVSSQGVLPCGPCGIISAFMYGLNCLVSNHFVLHLKGSNIKL